METERDELILISDQSAWDKVRKIALHRLDQLAGLEAKVLRGDKPDAIHDFRVAGRRFEQALELLSPPKMPPNLRRLRRKLVRGRKAISDVRDYDVFLGHVAKVLAGKKPPRREAWEAVRDYLVEKRARKHAKAVGELGKLNLSRTYIRMRSHLETGQPPSAKNSKASAMNASAGLGECSHGKRMAADLRRAWQAYEEATGQASDFSRAQAVHAARLAVKRLRYLMEIIHQFETPLSGQTLGVLRNQQQSLGDWHDAEIRERLLSKMAGRPEFLRRRLRLARDILRLMGESRKVKARIASRQPSVLDPAVSQQLKACVLSLLEGFTTEVRPDS